MGSIGAWNISLRLCNDFAGWEESRGIDGSATVAFALEAFCFHGSTHRIQTSGFCSRNERLETSEQRTFQDRHERLESRQPSAGGTRVAGYERPFRIGLEEGRIVHASRAGLSSHERHAPPRPRRSQKHATHQNRSPRTGRMRPRPFPRSRTIHVHTQEFTKLARRPHRQPS